MAVSMPAIISLGVWQAKGFPQRAVKTVTQVCKWVSGVFNTGEGGEGEGGGGGSYMQGRAWQA